MQCGFVLKEDISSRKCAENGKCHIMNFSLQHKIHSITVSSAPICTDLQLPTDVIHWSACIHTLRHLSQPRSRWRHLAQSISQLIGTKRLAFMLYPKIYERLKGCVGACMNAYISSICIPRSLKGIRLMCLLTPHLPLGFFLPRVPSPLPPSIYPSIHHLPLKAC